MCIDVHLIHPHTHGYTHVYTCTSYAQTCNDSQHTFDYVNFSFYVQARHARNKKWGVWHHMSDWGMGVQRSYVSKSDGVAQFIHVRLETNKSNLCDAFRIKIVAKNLQ